MPVDRSHAVITRRRFQFVPFRPPADQGEPLGDAGLADDEELIIFERHGLRRALVVREMAYHHVAQGELAGQPYLVSF